MRYRLYAAAAGIIVVMRVICYWSYAGCAGIIVVGAGSYAPTLATLPSLMVVGTHIAWIRPWASYISVSGRADRLIVRCANTICAASTSTALRRADRLHWLSGRSPAASDTIFAEGQRALL